MRSINSDPRDWARKILEDLMLQGDADKDIFSEEIKLNQTFTQIAGERKESVFENEDTPDFDLLDAGTGFDTINTAPKHSISHIDSGFSIGNRKESSEHILNELRAAGFDVKSQAKMMAYFYERGHF